ncbi:MAG: tRNA pseudouridine(55) synthase TruB [Flavobacteriales bacterium]|nr:tRNA pseudouridine(55) synthase TruB [Flavobacteriales bacterium]
MIDFQEGQLILIDKPFGKTSFQAVKFVKNQVKVKKVGHAGTLDPLATGLLIICTGKWTKKITGLQLQEKEYTGTLYLGATRPSFDMETEIDEYFDLDGMSEEKLQNAARSLSGFILQTPPVYSAVKLNGKRAYESARSGENIELKPREVEVKEFQITRIDLPEVDFRIVCSKGTYIRTLVSDFGKILNNGAYLSALRRTRIGDYKVEDAHTYEAFRNWVGSEL